MKTRRPHSRQRQIGALMLLGLAYVFASVPACAAEYEASAVKAAFLHRFAAYVQWPASSVKPGEPFLIAVLDDSAVVSHLERLLPDLTIQDRRAQVISIADLTEAKGAKIVYIGSSQAARTSALTSSIKGQPILVVTGHDGGLKDGAAINFLQVGRNVRFEVSLSAARANALQINSGLLSVAVRVEDGPRASSDSAGQIYLAVRSRLKKITRG